MILQAQNETMIRSKQWDDLMKQVVSSTQTTEMNGRKHWDDNKKTVLWQEFPLEILRQSTVFVWSKSERVIYWADYQLHTENRSESRNSALRRGQHRKSPPRGPLNVSFINILCCWHSFAQRRFSASFFPLQSLSTSHCPNPIFWLLT